MSLQGGRPSGATKLVSCRATMCNVCRPHQGELRAAHTWPQTAHQQEQLRAGPKRSQGSAPVPRLLREPVGRMGAGDAEETPCANCFPPSEPQRPPSPPLTTPPERITLGETSGGCHARGGLPLPSRRGLPPGLHSGLRLGSRSLFLFARKNPWPRGSSQRRCAGRKGQVPTT